MEARGDICGTVPATYVGAGGASGDPPLRPGRRLPNLFNGPTRSPRVGLLPFLWFGNPNQALTSLLSEQPAQRRRDPFREIREGL